MTKVDDIFSRFAAEIRAAAAQRDADEAAGLSPKTPSVLLPLEPDTPRSLGKEAASYEHPRDPPADLTDDEEAEWLAGYDEQSGRA